jgi:alpha-L-fucosidase
MKKSKEPEESAAEAQHDIISVGNLSAGGNSHPEAQWFAGGNLGLFLHWGLSAVEAEYELSWGMVKDKPWQGGEIAPERYWRNADLFQPGAYDPERYLAAAAAAGFTYAVLTAKHHDGYLLWPAGQSELGTKTHLKGRDLVGPFIDACRNVGLKVGLYYSPPDWWFSRSHLLFDYPGLKASVQELEETFRGLGVDHQPTICRKPDPEFAARRRDYIRSHIFELTDRWGKIDLLWFDGRGVPNHSAPVMELEEIRERLPGVVINPRLTGEGDFLTYECREQDEAPQGWWERCALWDRVGWGYHHSTTYRPGAEIFREFEATRQAGGNYLINVGPRADGQLPEAFFHELKAFGEARATR